MGKGCTQLQKYCLHFLINNIFTFLVILQFYKHFFEINLEINKIICLYSSFYDMPTVRTTLVRESRCLRRLKFRNVPVKRGICRSQCREGEKRVIKVYISLANSARFVLFDFPSAWKIRWRRATSAEINDRLRCHVTGIKRLDILQSCTYFFL